MNGGGAHIDFMRVIEIWCIFSGSILSTFSERNYGNWRETGVVLSYSQSDGRKRDVL